jgi:hypothetical protein
MEKRNRINSAHITNKEFNSRENSLININKNDMIKEELIRNNNMKKFQYSYSFKRNLSDISLLRPNLKINIFPNNKTFKFRKKRENNLKLDSLIIVNLSNKKLNLKPEIYINKKMHIIQPKIKRYGNIIIDNILNKRLSFNKSKAKKLKLEDYEKDILTTKQKKYINERLRPIVHFFRHDNDCINDRNNIIPFRSFSDDKNSIISNNNSNDNYISEIAYQTNGFSEKREKFVNKLTIEENNKNKKNFDYNSIIKENNNCNQNKIINNINSYRRINSGYSDKNIFNKINYNKLKLINQRGLQKMKIKSYIDLNEKIDLNAKIKKINRQKFNDLIRRSSKIFNKHKEKILKNNL